MTGPAEDLGRRAVELVLGRIDGGSTPEVTLLTPVLTARESSGQVPLRAPYFPSPQTPMTVENSNAQPHP